MNQKIKNALISVSDKENLISILKILKKYKVKIISSGGTYKSIKKLGYDWADNLYHLSYGMVDLPSGKMKSREGTVVDADDLIYDLIDTVKETTESLDKYQSSNELLDYERKYFTRNEK